MSDFNKTIKHWPGWVALLFVVVGLLAVGVTSDSGPRTPDERVEAITKRLACPVCQGESVYESRNPSSNGIRESVRDQVEEGVRSDEEIIQRVVIAYEGEELLVPTADGIEALAWALPATAFVVGVAGLTVAFRRWREGAEQLGEATEADYALVAAALEADAMSDESAEAAERSSPETGDPTR